MSIFVFILNNLLLGVSLAMDAFSASLVNGMKETNMKKRKMFFIAFLFALFQAAMPFIGWVCVKTVVKYFSAFETFIPYIALILLAFIGIKMIVDAVKENKEQQKTKQETLDDNIDSKEALTQNSTSEGEKQATSTITLGALIVQAIATSIDALSVGFTISEHNLGMALLSVLIIGIITFAICLVGVMLGRKFSKLFKNKASIFGGIVLILIGIEIFITGVFF